MANWGPFTLNSSRTGLQQRLYNPPPYSHALLLLNRRHVVTITCQQREANQHYVMFYLTNRKSINQETVGIAAKIFPWRSLVAVMSYHYRCQLYHPPGCMGNNTTREDTDKVSLLSADQNYILPSRPAGPQRGDFFTPEIPLESKHRVHIISDPWATEDNHITTQSMQIHPCRRIRWSKHKHNHITTQQSLTTGIACST